MLSQSSFHIMPKFTRFCPEAPSEISRKLNFFTDITNGQQKMNQKQTFLQKNNSNNKIPSTIGLIS